MTFTLDHVIQLLSLLLTFVLGSGVVAFFVRYGNRLSTNEKEIVEVKHTLADKVRQVEGLASEMTEVKITLTAIQQTLAELKESSSKLQLIGEMNVKIDGIYRAVEKAIPRTEFESWKENTQLWREGAQRQMNGLAKEIETTKSHIAQECPLSKKPLMA